MKLSEIVKNYRREFNIPMDQLAEESGLSKAYISMIENDMNPSTKKPITPSLDSLRKLAKGMRTDLDTLISIMDDTNVDLKMPRRKTESEIRISDDLAPLSIEESMIITAFKRLNADGKRKVCEYIADLLDSGKYTKDTPLQEKEA